MTEISPLLAFLLGLGAIPAFFLLVIAVESTGEWLRWSERRMERVRLAFVVAVALPCDWVLVSWLRGVWR